MRALISATRGLLRTPGFASAGVLSLALAIAANTIVFGVLNALILRPLPVDQPEQVFFVQREAGGGFGTHAFPFYRELRDRSTLFSGLAAYRISPMALQTEAGSQRVWGYLATGNYFDVLGIEPEIGRFFHAEDDRVPGEAPYAVLSYTSWRSRFGADPDIAGKTIRIKGRPFTILGVAPAGFRGTELFFVPDLWVPMMMQPHIEEWGWLENWKTWNIFVVGRVKPGITPAQAQAELNAVSTAVGRAQSIDPPPALTLVVPGLFGDMLRAPLQSFALAVMVLALLVLLAACVNIATLFGVRSIDRMREMGIKLALGAGRGRLSRELAAEVLILAVAGGLVGMALAHAVLRWLTLWRIPVDVPIQFDVSADWRVFLFALASAIVAGGLACIAPLLRVWRADPNAAMRPAHGAAWLHPNRARWRRLPMRDVLLAGQVACCCVLITAGVVSLHGLGGAFATRVAMDMDRVTAVGFDLSLAGYSPEAGRDLQRRLVEEAGAIPGVTSAAYGSSVPLYIDYSSTSIFPEQTVDPSHPVSYQSASYDVSPGYFATLGTRMLRGRDFSWQDAEHTPRVAIVNETLATSLGKASLTGWRLRSGCPTCRELEVIGIVEDGKYQTLAEPPRPVIFVPILQSQTLTTMMVVRSDLPQPAVARALREAIHRIDSGLPLYSVGGLDEVVAFVFVPAWAATIALNAFGILAALLVLTGVYGLAAHSVSRRAHEISVRAAIGAQPLQILRTILGRTAILMGTGSAMGVTIGVAASRVLQNVVYQATPHDPVVLAAAVAIMCAIGLGATWLPARRALAVDPVRALREN